MAARAYIDPEQTRLSRAQWARWEQVGLEPELDLEDLILDWTSDSAWDLNAKGALVSLDMERTIDGASTVKMTLRDPNGRLFSQWAKRTKDTTRLTRAQAREASKRTPVEVDEGWDPILGPHIVGAAMEVVLDGVTFRLVGVSYTHSTQELALTFEDRIVYLLRRKRSKKGKRADRALCTRAQFILSLLREVRIGRYRFVCPELLAKQPLDKAKTTSSMGRHALLHATRAASSASSSDDPEATEGGFAPSAKLTVKGAKATAKQRELMAGILNEARRLGASSTVQAACIACATQESTMGKDAGQTGNDDLGLFQQGRNWIDASDTMDPAKTTRAFLSGAINGGGAKGWKQLHGSLVRAPGGFEAAIKRVQVSVGGYAQWQNEAERAVEAFSGSEGNASSATGWETKRYQFARNSDEDSWTAMRRLAEEVGWQVFVVGNSVYFMSEKQLYGRRPRYELLPDDPAVTELSYDVDWGKPVSECSLTVALERWGAPPGSVVVLTGWGPPDGRWLVSSVSRNWFSPLAQVTLKQPGKQGLEPANEREQRSSQGGGGEGTDVDSGSKAGKVYNAAKAIHDKSYPYVWGGGHARCGTPDNGTGRDSGTGYDCSGSVCAALAAAGLGFRTGGPASDSGTMARSWGEPGKGRQFTVWANTQHVWIEWHGLGSAKRFDTSSAGGDTNGRGPRQRTTERSDQGSFTARHWPGV